MRYAACVPRVVMLPETGRLLVATDLQGHAADFERVERLYEEACRVADCALVITGDLVHGPEIEPADWPDYLGSYYRGDSVRVLQRARALQDRHPGRVFYLMGNHEHAHVGGPVVSKFFPDEAQRLESLLGEVEAEQARAWIRTWPFVAVAPAAGLVMSHAAPHAQIQSPEDLERLPLEGFDGVPMEEMALQSTMGALLWARTTSSERARAFLAALHPTATVSVFGHDVARGGYAVDREPLLCVSSSFGCFDGDKLYLDWDLAERPRSAADLAWRGLRPLYPNARPVHRAPL